MARDDWFRKQTWSAKDADEFQHRLRRCRGSSSKAQYLRIQAGHLAEAGLHDGALSLLSQLMQDFPEPFELASLHLQRAQSYAAVNDYERAITSYRDALVAEDAFPNVQPGTPLEFAWFIVTRTLTDLYGEVEPLLRRHEGKHGTTFPVERFKCAAARAMVADIEGRLADARRFASEAHDAANEQASGLNRHADLGIVDEVPVDVAKRLAAIRGART